MKYDPSDLAAGVCFIATLFAALFFFYVATP